MNTEQPKREYTPDQLEGFRIVDRILRRVAREKVEAQQAEVTNASA